MDPGICRREGGAPTGRRRDAVVRDDLALAAAAGPGPAAAAASPAPVPGPAAATLAPAPLPPPILRSKNARYGHAVVPLTDLFLSSADMPLIGSKFSACIHFAGLTFFFLALFFAPAPTAPPTLGTEPPHFVLRGGFAIR